MSLTQSQAIDLHFPTLLSSADADEQLQQRRAADAAALAELEERVGKEEAAELQELYKLVDKDDSGSISHAEFMELLHTLSVRPSPLEMDVMFGELDADGSGDIEQREFISFMTQPALHSQQGRDLIHTLSMVEKATPKPTAATGTPPKAAATSSSSAAAVAAHASSSIPAASPAAQAQLHAHVAQLRSVYCDDDVTGHVSAAQLVHMMRTYIPDKIKDENHGFQMLSHIRQSRDGTLDYLSFVAANTDFASCLPLPADARKPAAKPKSPPSAQQQSQTQSQAQAHSQTTQQQHTSHMQQHFSPAQQHESHNDDDKSNNHSHLHIDTAHKSDHTNSSINTTMVKHK